jgi:hypothetical protein
MISRRFRVEKELGMGPDSLLLLRYMTFSFVSFERLSGRLPES